MQDQIFQGTWPTGLP